MVRSLLKQESILLSISIILPFIIDPDEMKTVAEQAKKADKKQ